MKKTLAILLAAVMLCGLFVGCGKGVKKEPASPLDEYAHLEGVYVQYGSVSDYDLTIDFELNGEEVHPVITYEGYLGTMNDDATIVKLGEDGYLIRLSAKGAYGNKTHFFEITIDPEGTKAEVEWGDDIHYTCYRAEE